MLLDVTTQMEGHPDNVAPALYGGLCASVVGEDGRVLCVRYPVAPLRALRGADPRFSPRHPPRQGACCPRPSRARTRSLTSPAPPSSCAAWKWGTTPFSPPPLTTACTPPTRKALIHDFDFVRAQALEAGARALVISGAGPTLLALHPDPEAFAPADRGAPVRAPPQVARRAAARGYRGNGGGVKTSRARTGAAQCHRVFLSNKTAPSCTSQNGAEVCLYAAFSLQLRGRRERGPCQLRCPRT